MKVKKIITLFLTCAIVLSVFALQASANEWSVYAAPHTDKVTGYHDNIYYTASAIANVNYGTGTLKTAASARLQVTITGTQTNDGGLTTNSKTTSTIVNAGTEAKANWAPDSGYNAKAIGFNYYMNSTKIETLVLSGWNY